CSTTVSVGLDSW
nr:immunoglobulin heavy chain junction region [Macaca mulatta]MOV35768.1 immunoglobulin heavy chain junction region [Macaca mulatta]MOV35778.1 immunoglobulin heavy chain junction region [Macaca mulatta]MOV35785.1 immunoglobulin heavy chain junction region [Macaca mulatta]MOV35807.1 immunoglobulin heavy chain junction region [Macaca mulatta]